MAHRLLHKLSFTRKHSGPTTPTIYAGISPGTAVVPPSQDPAPSSSAVISTSPTAYPRYSNPPIPLVDFPPPDFRPSSGSRRPRQSVNLFKKLLGKQQPAPPRVTAPRSRSRKTWEKELQEFRFDDDAGARDGNSKDGSPKVKTPTSWELHWDCAKTEYRDSMEVRTPVFSTEGLALCELPSPTDIVYPTDYRSARRSAASLGPKEIRSPKWSSDHESDASPPTGSSVIAACPPSPSQYSLNSSSSTYNYELKTATSHIIGSPRQEELGYSGSRFSPPKRERETRPISLVLRPASSSGPALQTLSPPPPRVCLAARRGTTLPSPLPPAPSTRRRSPRSIKQQSQILVESTQNVSEPGSPASLTPEEGLIQLQLWTQHTDSHAPLGYRRSFKHVRGLNSRTLRSASRLPPLSITASRVKARLDDLDDAEIQSEPKERQIEPASASSSDESEPLSTPPDDTIPGITITRARKGSSATSKHTQSSRHAREDKYASSFLDFEPLSPPTPATPATQSSFTIAQSQMFTSGSIISYGSVDGPVEQSYAGNAADHHTKQCDRGARRRSSPTPGSTSNSLRSSRTRPSPLSPNELHTVTRSSVYSNGVKTEGCGTNSTHSTGAAGKSLRRRKSGVVRRGQRPRSRSGNNVTRSRNDVTGGSTIAISDVGLHSESRSRMKGNEPSPAGVAR